MAKRMISDLDVDAVKDAVSIRDAVEAYLPDETIDRDRIRCPFHGGKDRNCRVTNGQFYCFVCHEGGDVVSFVRKLYRLDFAETVRKLNEDFRVGLDLDSLQSKEQVAELRLKRFKARQREAIDQYLLACNTAENGFLCDLRRLVSGYILEVEPYTELFEQAIQTLTGIDNALSRNQAEYDEIRGRLNGKA